MPGSDYAFTFEVKELPENWVRTVGKGMERFYRRWLDLIAAFILRESLLAFDKQQQPGGGAWDALSDDYAARKEAAGKSPLANIWSGALRKSLSIDTKGTGLEKEAHVGTTAYYGRWIQEGTKNNLPARPYMIKESAARRKGQSIANRLFKDTVKGIF